VVRVPGYRFRGPGFDFQRYQIFREVVGLERGPLSLVSTIEKLLEGKGSDSGLESRECGRRDPSRWPRGNLYPQKLSLTSPTSGGRSVGIVRSRTKATKFSLVLAQSAVWRLARIPPTECRSRRKGNPPPWGITGPPCHLGFDTVLTALLCKLLRNVKTDKCRQIWQNILGRPWLERAAEFSSQEFEGFLVGNFTTAMARTTEVPRLACGTGTQVLVSGVKRT
jgi:hypothetical protein